MLYTLRTAYNVDYKYIKLHAAYIMIYVMKNLFKEQYLNTMKDSFIVVSMFL